MRWVIYNWTGQREGYFASKRDALNSRREWTRVLREPFILRREAR